MNNDGPAYTDLIIHTTVEALALGRVVIPAHHVDTPLVRLCVFTTVDGQSVETRVKISSEALADARMMRDFMAHSVLKSIHNSLHG